MNIKASINVFLVYNSSLFFFLYDLKQKQNGQADPKIHTELQGALNRQNNLEKE